MKGGTPLRGAQASGEGWAVEVHLLQTWEKVLWDASTLTPAAKTPATENRDRGQAPTAHIQMQALQDSMRVGQVPSVRRNRRDAPSRGWGQTSGAHSRETEVSLVRHDSDAPAGAR